MRAVRLTVVTAAATAAALAAVTGCTAEERRQGRRRPRRRGHRHRRQRARSPRPSSRPATSSCPSRTRAPRSPRSTSYVPGRPDRHRAGEHRPRHQADAHRRGEGRLVRDRLQARHEGRRHPAEGHRHRRQGRQARPPAGQGRRRLPRRTRRSRPTRRCPRSQTFADAVQGGDLEAAKKAYAPSRVGWERTEPVAESFGDIDPKVDVRADGLEDRARSGPAGTAGEGAVAGQEDRSAGDRKLADAARSRTSRTGRSGSARPRSPRPPWPTAPRNSSTRSPPARSPARRSATRHTDLVDFKANVEGAREGVRAAQAGRRGERPGAGQGAGQAVRRAGHAARQVPRRTRPPTASPPTTRSARRERKELSDAVNALAEPLSKLAAAVVEVAVRGTQEHEAQDDDGHQDGTETDGTRPDSRPRAPSRGVRCSAGAVPGSRSVPPRPAARSP